MTEKSTTEKLQELYDLYKSGAVTKEEYESLKADLIKDNRNSNQEKKDSGSIQPLENTSQVVKDNPTGRKNRKIWVISSVVVLLVAIIVLVLIIPKSKSRNKSESQITFATWDEATARKIITAELERHFEWGFSCTYTATALQYNIGKFNHLTIRGREIFVVMAGTQLDSKYCPPCCDTKASVFEFENNNGWQLYQKALGFASVDLKSEIKFYETNTGSYGIQITSVYGGGRGDVEEPRTEISKYSFKNKKLISVE